MLKTKKTVGGGSSGDVLNLVRNSKPSFWMLLRRWEASASYAHTIGCPYPLFGFGQMREEREGKLPVSMPLARTAVNQITYNLFGEAPILVASRKEIQETVGKLWDYRIAPMLQTIRNKCAIFGSALLQYSISEIGDVKFTLRDCRNYYVVNAPDDMEKILAVVIRYPVATSDGKGAWAVEVWTDEVKVTYDPIPQTEAFNYAFSSGVSGSGSGAGATIIPFLMKGCWEDSFVAGLSTSELKGEKVVAHGYGCLPMVEIVNKIDPVSLSPQGDLFNLRHILRRLDLVYNLMDISNQNEADPKLVFKNVDAQEEMPDYGNAPGVNFHVQSSVTEDGTILPGDVLMLESKGSMRTHMTTYATDMRAMFYETLNIVMTRPEEVTNKGNMTPGVMSQMNAPIEKGLSNLRLNFGKGSCDLLEKLTVSLSLFGKKLGTGGEKFSALPNNTFDLLGEFQFKYGSGYNHDEQQKLYTVERIFRELEKGLISIEAAIRIVANLEGIDKDIEDWIGTQIAIAQKKEDSAEEALKMKGMGAGAGAAGEVGAKGAQSPRAEKS